MPVGRPAFLVPRFFSIGDGRFATFGRDAGRRPAFLVPRFFAVGETGVPGPALLRDWRWEVRDLRPSGRDAGKTGVFLLVRDPALLRGGRWEASGRDAGRKTGAPGPALLRGGRWEVRDLRPRCRSEDRRSWSRASSRWAMGGSRPSAAMPVGRPAFLVPRFFAVGDGRFATSGRDAGRKTGVPGPALLRGGRWEVRDLRPRCRSEDRRSWSRASSRWAMGGSRRPRCRSTGVPGPALLRGGRWEVRDLRPRCRSEDRRSWSRASSRWAMGGSRPPAAMPVGRPAFGLKTDAGRKTGAPGPALLRGGRWEVRDLRPRCRSEDRRSLLLPALLAVVG